MLNLATNKITPDGGLHEWEAAEMQLKSNLLDAYTLPKQTAATEANMGGDPLTSAHMKNWMECVKANNIKTNCPVEAGHSHTIACAMANAAFRTGLRTTYDPGRQQIMAGNKVFKY
jgi:hypothetical protein